MNKINSERLTLSHLNIQYRKELEELDRYRLWIKTNADKPWNERDHRNRPNPNKAKVKRLGITIRQMMVEAERGL